ncbi:MAG: helix-turn-helix domain-containing protein [Bacillota bacterium]
MYDEPIIEVETLMDLLKIGRGTAYHLLNTGAIKAFRIGRKWKIPTSTLDEFIINSAVNTSKYSILE